MTVTDQLKVELVDQAGGLQNAARPIAAKHRPGELLELRINR